VCCGGAQQQGFVAIHHGRVVGFLTVVRHFEESAEVTWMAVHARYRRRGVGRRVSDELCTHLRREGRRLLIVLTMSPSDPGPEPEDGYQATRAFYRAVGFVEARDFPGYWSRDTPVLPVRTLPS
jgi:ribosomal protein S18 acetylase RimI-like enzyme